MQDNVTQSDLRWRKRFHEVTGYVDMDMALAKLIARHRVASTTTQSEAVQKLVEQVAMSTAEMMRAVEALPSETNEQRRLIAALKRTCDCNRQTLAAHRESQP